MDLITIVLLIILILFIGVPILVTFILIGTLLFGEKVEVEADTDTQTLKASQANGKPNASSSPTPAQPKPDPDYYNLNNVLVNPPYLDTITNTTLSTCKKSCSNRPECVGYTWSKDRKCNLLGNVGVLKSHEDYVTLLKYRPNEPGHKFGQVDNYLASTEMTRTDILSQPDCEKKCMDDPECRGYVYIDEPKADESKCNILNDIDTFRVLAKNKRYKTMLKFF